jgi:hypothetical protein
MCIKCIATNNLSKDYLDGLPAVFKQAMQDLYDGKISPADLHGEFLQAIANELWQGVSLGFDTDLDGTDLSSERALLVKSFEENIFVFSGFKTYHVLKEASLMMLDEAGVKKPFTQFLTDVQKLNKTYNITYLRNEWDNANVSADMATKWFEFSDDGLLKFIATIDDHTTEICHSLNGLIKPKTWNGWKNYFLPLHWGERSNIIEVVDGEISPIHESDLEEPKGMFNGNIALDGVIFPDTHPYFEVPKGAKEKITQLSKSFIPKQK